MYLPKPCHIIFLLLQELLYCDLPFQLSIMILRFIHAAASGNGPLISTAV